MMISNNASTLQNSVTDESMIKFLTEDTVFYEPGVTTATFEPANVKQMQDEKGLQINCQIH